jgi:hypothetical protein
LKKVYTAILLSSMLASASACSGQYGGGLPAAALAAPAPAAVTTPAATGVGGAIRRKHHAFDITLTLEFNGTPTATVPAGTPVQFKALIVNNDPVAYPGLSFADETPFVSPAGTLKVSATPTAQFACVGGTMHATPNATILGVNNFTLPANGTCWIEVWVIASSAGTYVDSEWQLKLPPLDKLEVASASATLVATLPASKRLYVPDGTTNRVLVYSNTATGSTPPTWTISGASTALSNPTMVAADGNNGDVYVLNAPQSASEYVTVYPVSMFAAVPQGGTVNQQPVRNFSIPAFADLLSGVQGMAVDSGHELIAAFNDSLHPGNDGVYWFANGADGTAPTMTFWPDPAGVGWNSVSTDVSGNRVFLADSLGHGIETYSNASGVPANSSATLCQMNPAPIGSSNYFQIAWGGEERMLFISSRWAPQGGYWGEIQNLDPCVGSTLFEDINAGVLGGGLTEMTMGGPIAADPTTKRISMTVIPLSNLKPTANQTPHILSWPWELANGNVAPSFDLAGNCQTCSGSMSYAFKPALFAYGP